MNFGFWPSRQIVHCADCRECAATLSRLAYRRRPTQQLRQLGEVHRQPPRLVARQPIWSPSDATQRYVRNWARSGSGLRLKYVDDLIRTCAPVNCCCTKRPLNPVSVGERTCCNCTAGLDSRISLHAGPTRSKGADGEMAVKKANKGRFTT
jgi:hypothetical protein